MARLNTSNPQAASFPRRKIGLVDQSDRSIDNSSRKESPPSTRPPKTSARKKTGSNAVFDIFQDDDANEEGEKPAKVTSSPSVSPTKQKKKRTLNAAPVNSLLLPLQQRPRQRPTVKVETDDYEKENDIMEETIDPYETSMESVSQRSPARRNTPGTPPRGRRNARPLSPPSPETETADEDCGDNSFESLEDFIVSDNDEPSYHETSDSETEDEKSPAPSPPPKPTRKRLMRGRRPGGNQETKELKDSSVKESFSLSPKIPDAVNLHSAPSENPRHGFQDSQEDLHLSTKLNELNIDDDNGPASQLETDLTRSAIDLESSPVHTTTKAERAESPVKSPTPSPTLQRSPTKSKTRIPPTPHRESTDAFWSQDLTNDWVDQHSPRKADISGRSVLDLLQEFDNSDTEADSNDSTSTEPDSMFRQDPRSPPTPTVKTPSKTALKKVAAAEKRAVKEKRALFDQSKDQYAREFLETLDNAVTGGQVLQLASLTGGVQIIWSKTLLKTAGRASWKGESTTVRSENGGPMAVVVTRHHCKIELAERIVDNEYRIINTVAHEYCHLANYLISKVHDNPHGPSFKRWGQRCTEAMRNHPMYGNQIHVTTRHSYAIEYKYVWNCTGCGLDYGRHSKSIDPGRMRCGSCQGRLEQVKPKPRKVSPKKNAAVDTVTEGVQVVTL